jgi:hypothetical protein
MAGAGRLDNPEPGAGKVESAGGSGQGSAEAEAAAGSLIGGEAVMPAE